MKLRYTGQQATVFRTCNVGHVEPLGEFDVLDEEAPRFLRRRDVEHVDPCPNPPCRCGLPPEPEPDAEPEEVAAKPRRSRPARQTDGDADGADGSTPPEGGE